MTTAGGGDVVTGVTGGWGAGGSAAGRARGAAAGGGEGPRAGAGTAGAEVAVGNYDDREGLRRAFEGAHTLFMVSASEDPDRMRLHGNVVGAATDAGVGRVVYTSFYGAGPACTFTFGRDHWHTEELIRGSGLRHTFLRDNLYIDFLPLMVGGDGVIRGPAGDGRVAAVARDDIADVAVAVLLDDGGGHDGRAYDMTGPEALTMAEAAEELSRAAGRTITYHAETLEEAYASRAHYGAPDWEVAGWVTTYAAIANGDLETVSGDVAAVAGHPPIGLREFLRRNPDSYRRLAGAPGPERRRAPGSPLRPGAGLADPGHLAFGVALGQGLALVVGALAPGQAQLDLDQVALEVDAQGDQGEAALVDAGRQLVDLLAVEQELAGAGRLVALVAGVGVGGDLHVQDELVAVDHGVGVLERPFALAEGLDLAAAQDQAGLDRLEDLVVVAGTAVGRDRARGLAPGHPRDRR